MRFNQKKAQNAYAQVGWALGGEGDTETLAEHAISSIESFIHQEVGIPKTLDEIGIPASAIGALANEAFKDMDLMTNPVRVKSVDELNVLFQKLT